MALNCPRQNRGSLAAPAAGAFLAAGRPTGQPQYCDLRANARPLSGRYRWLCGRRDTEAAPSLLATARTNSGYAHLSLKQYDNAKQDFEAALREQSTNSPAYRGLGLVAQRAGDFAQAAQDYEKSVELQPTPVGYLLLGRALELGGQPEAAKAAQSQAVNMTQDLNDDVATARRLLAN